MPKLTIDGKEIEFKPGQTVIQAAKDNGIYIPHFCWHPSLSVSGNCRMCLVEIERIPKLAISCSTYASDGMVVHTQSEKAVEARNAVMEFFLINHPLDCPICDKAGECHLQDYTYKYSLGESRFIEEKTHNVKHVDIGPRIKFDAERCIKCSRCIRFTDEIAKSPQLTFTMRGDRVTLSTFPDEEFDNPYTLNTVDICPVGALTSKDFRFKARVWDMSYTDSVCIGCSRGCNIEIGVRNNKILRLTPRFNKDVNDYWMCDSGRLDTFKFVNSDDRINGSFIRKNGELKQSDWKDAEREAIRSLKLFKPQEIAFIGSAFATCEDNYSLLKLARRIGTSNIDFFRHLIPGSGDDVLITEDKSPNALGAELIGIVPANNGISYKDLKDAVKSKKIKALYVIDEDIIALDNSFEEILTKLDLLIVHSHNWNSTAKLSDILFASSTYAEKHGTFVNFQGRVQRIRPAVTTATMDRALDNLEMSRLDKFGTEYDRWASGVKIDAKGSWKIISDLLSALGEKREFNMAEEVFDELAGRNKYFKGLDYDTIGKSGAFLKNFKIIETQTA